jgi:flagellar protein FliL
MSETVAAPAPKPKSKRKLIVGAVLTLGVAGGGAAGYFVAGKTTQAVKDEGPPKPKLVLRDKAEAPAEPGGEGETKVLRRTGTVTVEKDSVTVDPRKYAVAYYPIGQSFTANLADGSGFVQVGLSAATYFDSGVADNLARQEVPIRSAILLALSDQQASVLATPEGKQILQRHLTQAINRVLREREGFGGIDNVYFTSFVVQ